MFINKSSISISVAELWEIMDRLNWDVKELAEYAGVSHITAKEWLSISWDKKRPFNRVNEDKVYTLMLQRRFNHYKYTQLMMDLYNRVFNCNYVLP